ncbi:MAG TPA: ribbon-helix-helix protein, CopG family [Thermoanaerobaculia bacterium]|nr:ribbon-helix-helix protein, CopG family [Thermoanaerobaculia bacterium]
MARQLTIRYDDALAREIEELARQEGISRNQAR